MTKRTTTILGGCLCSLALLACGSDGDSDKTSESAKPAQASESTSNASSDKAADSAAASGDKSQSNDAKSGSDSSAKAGSDSKAEPAKGTDAAKSGQDQSGQAQSGMQGSQTASTPGAIDWQGDIRGKCQDFKTKFPGDEACIPAPPAAEGLQIHIGPSNWDDADEVAKYVLHPGEESSECFTVTTPNDKMIHYQTSVLSGRAGTHHIINTMYAGDGSFNEGSAKCISEGGGDMSNSLGSLPGASKPYMPRGIVAPEYAHVGRGIPAHARVSSDMHYYNFTDHDIVREYWLNIYYAKDEDITEEASQIAGLGGFSWNKTPIPPMTDKTYSYSCPIKGDGYILMLLGHYHAHGKHFTASITRKATGKADKVFEMFDYMEPAQFEYNTVITNPMFSDSAAGAVSGRLAVSDGDTINWDCHIVNDSDVGLKYVNEVKTGEMCNLWGSSIGISPISCYLQ